MIGGMRGRSQNSPAAAITPKLAFRQVRMRICASWPAYTLRYNNRSGAKSKVSGPWSGKFFPELFQVFKNLEGDTSQALLLTCPPAVSIRQMTVETFITKVRSAYTGKRLLVSKLARLHQLATSSIGVSQGLSAIQLAIQVHLTYLQSLQEQLEKVTRAMTDALLSLPEAPYLLSIKFLGPVSAATFLADIGDPKRYHAATQWVKLAGIQPVPRTSGRKQRSLTPMSHQGRPRLRTMLYFTCLRMIQQDDHFAQLYAHLQKRQNNPLTKMQALGVLMNKLLHILWALIHNQTFYNPAFSQST
jgi:transposase